MYNLIILFRIYFVQISALKFLHEYGIRFFGVLNLVFSLKMFDPIMAILFRINFPIRIFCVNAVLESNPRSCTELI